MIGFDRPTWIKFLNPRTTWFLTGQFFWSYVNGGYSQPARRHPHSRRESVLHTAGKQSEPAGGRPKQGFGQWDNGPYAGAIERTQTACTGNVATAPNTPCAPGSGLPNNLFGNADKFCSGRRWSRSAATSFYWGGTFVPFVAVAIDPMNRATYSPAQVRLLHHQQPDRPATARSSSTISVRAGRRSIRGAPAA